MRIDINASIASIFPMGTTITIRNLDETVKQKLRIRAARRQISMEAEVRAILTNTVNEPDTMAPPRTVEEMRARLASVRGIWKDHACGRDTDAIMKELRGDD